jgi:hypothetical protein
MKVAAGDDVHFGAGCGLGAGPEAHHGHALATRYQSSDQLLEVHVTAGLAIQIVRQDPDMDLPHGYPFLQTSGLMPLALDCRF